MHWIENFEGEARRAGRFVESEVGNMKVNLDGAKVGKPEKD